MNAPVGLVDAITDRARRDPDAIALWWRDEAITYAQLTHLAERARTELVASGLDAGVPVGLLAVKSPSSVAFALGCLLAGNPLLLLSAALPATVQDQVLDQVGCSRLYTPQGRHERATADPSVARPVPAGTAFLLTTSGSTGAPKVVPIAAEAVHRFVGWAGEAAGLAPGVTVLNYAPLNFDLCLFDIWATLAHGGNVVLVEPELAANGTHLRDLLVRHDVEVVQAVPMFFQLVRDAVAAGEPAATGRFPRVREVLFTGDVLPGTLLAELPAMFPRARLRNLYGCTETNDSFLHEVEPTASGPVPIGTALPGVRAVVVDEHGGVVTGPGRGELYVWTPFQTKGYLDERRFADRFGPHPTGADDLSYFRTGDLVVRDADGLLFLVGRSDHQVKVRGVAINTAQVEQVLLSHPQVLEAAVVATPDALTGHRLLGHVRRAPDSRLNSLTLREHCARLLPAAGIPTVLRIGDADLPRTSTGKVDRGALGGPGSRADTSAVTH